MFIRYRDENEVMDKLRCDYLGEPFRAQNPTDAIEPIVSGVVNYFLSSLDANTRIDLGMMAREGIGMIDRNTIESLASGQEERDPATTRMLMMTNFNSLMGILGDGQTNVISGSFVRDYQNAQTYAVSHGIETPVVFGKVAVFEDFMRTTRTPQDYTDELVGHIDGVRPDLVINAVIEVERAQAIVEGAMTPREVAALEEDFAELRNDPAAIAEFTALTTRSKAGAAYAVSRQVERFWGKGALGELTPGSRQHLEDLQVAYTPPAPPLFPSLSSLLNHYPDDRDEY